MRTTGTRSPSTARSTSRSCSCGTCTCKVRRPLAHRPRRAGLKLLGIPFSPSEQQKTGSYYSNYAIPFPPYSTDSLRAIKAALCSPRASAGSCSGCSPVSPHPPADAIRGAINEIDVRLRKYTPLVATSNGCTMTLCLLAAQRVLDHPPLLACLLTFPPSSSAPTSGTPVPSCATSCPRIAATPPTPPPPPRPLSSAPC